MLVTRKLIEIQHRTQSPSTKACRQDRRWLGIGLLALLAVFLAGGLVQAQELLARATDILHHKTATSPYYTVDTVPAFSGQPYVVINRNTPYFQGSDLSVHSYSRYSELDSWGRCKVAKACIGRDIMPKAPRGQIGQIKPSGWHTVRYSGVDGKYLYNRCHLIGYQLAGENSNPRNLITGTRYLNMQGMLPFENLVADYVKETGNHVMYRVTPIYSGRSLVAHGVLMEGLSVEDGGAGVSYCVFCYNAQPHIKINYATGESSASSGYGETKPATQRPNRGQTSMRHDYAAGATSAAQGYSAGNSSGGYVLNIRSKRFHKPTCSSVTQMKAKNQRASNASREALISEGYKPCGSCRP